MNVAQREREILKFWKEADCFGRLAAKNRGKPTWSFIDGPITANNPMGVHHAWGRTYKDLYQRFQAMTGHDLRHQNGFDCQGLWVEVEVEKELGFQSKRDIEEYGIAPFIEKCKERVRKYARIQTEQSIRLGYWMDWDNSYYTMSDENNYTIWQFLKRCHEKGYIYHGWDAMPWCPRCGTGISQHEISSEDRPEVLHVSPTVRLPIRGRDNEYLLIWTTTPWTLTSNAACAVHPERTYQQVRQGDSSYYLIAERREAVMGPKGEIAVVRELSGEEMVGWRYDGPFDELEAQDPSVHRVIPWKEVSAEEGTGIVHIAPGCGKEDYELGREFGFQPIAPIDENGVFTEGFEPFTGKFAGDVADQVLQSLREKRLLYRAEKYRHNYPICWRCKSQLLFRLVDEWFISMDRLRHQIIEVTRQTQWIPEVGRQLEIEWLENMHDWMISKKRYWGLALPIYPCGQCGTFEVMGGKEELKQRAIEGWERFEGHSPHRPYVDEVRIACGGCGKPVSRIQDVGNPWLDAGIVPYSTLHYNTDRSYWEKWFPADWISESFPGQFRNWFYSILAMSTVMENRAPFKMNFGYRLMKDEDGEEMHKSKGNAIDFNEAAEKVGADPMRWLYASHNPAYNLHFGYHKIRDAWRQFLPLWNVFEFYATYSEIDKFDPSKAPIPYSERAPLDRWILGVLETLIVSAHENYGRYAVHVFMRDVIAFIDALSRWYLRRSRRRIWKSEDDSDKWAAYHTLWECLETFCRLLAPVIPFACEDMYQKLVRPHFQAAEVSVHVRDFPRPGDLPLDERLLRDMETVRQVVELGHAARSAAGTKVRQPLPRLLVAGSDGLGAILEAHGETILDELNVKSIESDVPLTDRLTCTLRLDSKSARPKFKQDFDRVLGALREMPLKEIERVKNTGGTAVIDVDGDRFEVEAADILVDKQAPEGWSFAEGNGILALLDTRLSPNLIREGLVRDLVRQIQQLRRDLDFHVADRIRVRFSAGPELAAAIEQDGDYLAQEVLAQELVADPQAAQDGVEKSVGEYKIHLALAKIAAS